jgi:hypothetical protein
VNYALLKDDPRRSIWPGDALSAEPTEPLPETQPDE